MRERVNQDLHLAIYYSQEGSEEGKTVLMHDMARCKVVVLPLYISWKLHTTVPDR